MSFGAALVRRAAKRAVAAGEERLRRAREVADVAGATFDTERKAAQARAIDLAVQEIQRGIAANPEAAQQFNEALAPGEAQVARHGVEEAAAEVARKACEGAGLEWDGNQCKKPGSEPSKAPPADQASKAIPPELVRGWAGFVAEWRAALRSMEETPAFVGADVDTLLERFTGRIREWQKKFAPFIPVSVELPEYREDTSGAPGWLIGAAIGVPVVGAILVGGYYYLRRKVREFNDSRQGQGSQA